MRNNLQGDLFAPPVIERPAALPSGAIFHYGGRALLIVRSLGTDAAAPVIVRELSGGSTWLAGQYAIWSAAAVSKLIKR
jgi:hypothetical protein